MERRIVPSPHSFARKSDILPMVVRYALPLLMTAACASRSDLSILDEEVLRFRAENERIRVEDLEARCR